MTSENAINAKFVEIPSLLKSRHQVYCGPQIGLEMPLDRCAWCRSVPGMGRKPTAKESFNGLALSTHLGGHKGQRRKRRPRTKEDRGDSPGWPHHAARYTSPFGGCSGSVSSVDRFSCLEAEAELYRDEHHRARQVSTRLEHVADYEGIDNCRFSAEARPLYSTRVRRVRVRGIPPRAASGNRAPSRSRGCDCAPSRARRSARWRSLWRTCLRRAGLAPPIAGGSG